jgi:hypothetical protein
MILIFKGLTLRRLYKSFGVKGLIKFKVYKVIMCYSGTFLSVRLNFLYLSLNSDSEHERMLRILHLLHYLPPSRHQPIPYALSTHGCLATYTCRYKSLNPLNEQVLSCEQDQRDFDQREGNLQVEEFCTRVYPKYSGLVPPPI